MFGIVNGSKVRIVLGNLPKNSTKYRVNLWKLHNIGSLILINLGIKM